MANSLGDGVDNSGINETQNRNCDEQHVEYTSPFTQHARKCLVIPPNPTKHNTTSKQHTVTATQPGHFEEQHYEGCDVVPIPKPVPQARRAAGVHPGIMAEYSELERN